MTIRCTKIFVVLLLLAMSTACTRGRSPTDASQLNAAPTVIVKRVELKPLVDQIQALGTANANESIQIQPRIASVITGIKFKEGQLVNEGDLLVELDRSEIVAGLALAKAQLTESQSLYDRSKSLASTQAISASSLDQLLAQVQVNQAQVEAARARLDLTAIRAPFSGRVGLRKVSPGSFVDTSTIITTLDDIGTIKLDFSVPETYLTEVRKGMKISAQTIVYPDRIFTGTVASIDTRLDPVARSVQVRALLPNADNVIKPGMFMTIELQRDQGEVLMAPEQAIVPEGSEQFVYVVANGISEKRAVQLGRRIPGFVVIRDGLSVGESVITEGTGKVHNGATVDVTGDGTASSGANGAN